MMKFQLQEINLSWKEVGHLAKDHGNWKDILMQ